MKEAPSYAHDPNTPKRQRVRWSFADRSLQTKLILAFLAVTALSVSAVAFFSNRTTSTELTTQAGSALHQEALTQAQAVGDLLNREVDTLRTFSLDKFIQDQVAAINATYIGDPASIQAQLESLDKAWVAAEDGDPLIQHYLTNQVAEQLRSYRSAFPDNVEVFVTDKYGANVAASNRTTDYYQADEDWWQAAWNNGQGAVYIGQPEFDQSSRSFSIIIALPLYGQGKAVIGILRTTYQLDKLIAMIASVRVGSTGQAQLVLPGGRYVTQDKLVANLDPAAAAQIQSASDGVIQFIYQGAQRFVSQAPITNTAGDSLIGGLGWRLVVHQETAESLRPANSAVQTILGVAVGALLLAVLLGFWIAHAISAPLGRLTQVAQQIAQGDLGRRLRLPQHDEIGRLALSFDMMADTLEARLAEQQQTYEALATQHAEQQRLLHVISELETPIIPLVRDVLLAPLVGSLDVQRAEAACTRILTNIAERQARWVILDLTGVALAEHAVIHELLKIAQSVHLLGARALFTGINSEMALMLTQLGIDLDEFYSVATLEAGIEAVLNQNTASL
jgi:anti-anti-sigma regulatory factor/methyl-accepting chemotaxis protein